MRRIIILLTILYSYVVVAQDYTEDYIFNNIKEGLTKRAVTSITQDSKGFIWISTFGSGLYRFDGVNYKFYEYDWEDATTINSNLVYQVLMDQNELLWIATDNGLSTYNSAIDQFDRIELPEDNTTDENLNVLSLGQDHQGNIYISTGQSGVFRINTDTREILSIPTGDGVYTENLIAWEMITSPSGKVLLASTQGLLEIDEEKGCLTHAKFHDGYSSKTIDVSSVSLMIDDEGSYWIGTRYDGVFKAYKAQEKGNPVWKIENIAISNKRILSIVQSKEGHVLIGTENEGLFVLNRSGNLLKKHFYSKYNGENIQSNSIWTLYEDRSNRIWLGYYDKGIGLYDPLYNKFQSIKSSANNTNSLQVGSVTAIVKGSDEKLWIGMDGGGIDIYDPESRQFEHLGEPDAAIRGLDNLAIQSLFLDSRENMWAGSWDGGVFFLKRGSNKFVNYTAENTNFQLMSNRILSIDEDSRGVIWMGSFGNGLQSYDLRTGQFKSYQEGPFRNHAIVNGDIRKVLVDRNDVIWIGTTRGLFSLRLDQNESPILVDHREQMSAGFKDHTSINHVLSLFEDDQSNIWIGTDGAGLCKYDSREDQFVWYNKQNGLQHETVCGIISGNKGELWLSGKAGITKLNPADTTAIYYSVLDGLLSNDFNNNAVYKNEEGVLFFGDFVGIDYFDPNNIPINKIQPEIYLTDFKLFNSSVQPNDQHAVLTKVITQTHEITLNHEQSVFTIDFTALNYTRPEDNEYAFYLEGLEEDWNYVGNSRSATYTSLKQGSYVFKVKASNNDGIWNEDYTSLVINVLPPWWRTNLALGIYIVIFVLMLMFLLKTVRDGENNKLLVRAEVEKRRNEEELHDKKLQFFTNISHEFRTPLTLILNPLRDILNDSDLHLPNHVQSKHQVILKNADRLKRLVDELMDFRKLKVKKLGVKVEELVVGEFLNSVALYFQEEADQHNIELDLIKKPFVDKLWVDKGMLEKIAFNLLSNAFKVSTEYGKVKLQLEKTRHVFDDDEELDAIAIRISDTGSGLQPEQIERIFDRFYQVDEHNKEYYGGTGIGLEVVKDFVGLNKGDVLVESQVGVGTAFIIYFRTGNLHFTEEQKIKSTGVSEEDETFENVIIPDLSDDHPISMSSQKVLIVEDNIDLREYLVSELSKYYRVLSAKNGLEGLEKAVHELPNVIITDVVMPEMNGLQLCEKLKSNSRTSHIPLMMLTARSAVEDQIEGINKGADAYINKPFDMGVLKSKLIQLVESREIIFKKYFSGISDSDEVKNTTSLDKQFLESLLNYINSNISQANLSVESLAEELNLSRSQLYRKVKNLTGKTANEFIRSIRLEHAKKIIESGNHNIAEVSYIVGFSSPSYFTKCFKDMFEILPTDLE